MMIKTKVDGKEFPIRCPEEGCKHELVDSEVRDFVKDDTFKKYEDF